MDPITIGITVGTLLIARLTEKLIENAADPESIAKSVNWIFTAVDHFLKVRKNERAKDTPIPSPPVPTPTTKPPVQINQDDAEEKAQAVEEIAQSLRQEHQVSPDEGVYLTTMDDFRMEVMAKEIIGLMKQIETYEGNLSHELNKASQYGGVDFAPTIVVNTIRIQQENIATLVRRLNETVQRLYGVSAPEMDLDALVEVAEN
jgi:hypothetical protein